MSEFWNGWHDLSNNPSGLSERSIVYEKGALLSQTFRDLYNDMSQLENEINISLDAGVNKINDIIQKITDLNEQIISIEAGGNANDLHDRRNTLVTQLAEYIDIKYYENEDGNLTVTTGRGYVLVSRSSHYPLDFDGNNINWQSSGNSNVDITDIIAGGRLGGWLDLRDAIIPEIKSELDELAETIIWQVNSIHSQGVGLEGHSDSTGAYAVTDATEELWTVDSGLNYYDSIVSTGTFEVWVYDSSGNVVGGGSTTIDLDSVTVTSLQGLATTIDAIANINASVTPENKLRIYADSGYSLAFSNDTSNVLAALGLNNFFTGTDANTMDMNSALDVNGRLIATGQIGTAGEIAAGDNSNAINITDLQFQDVVMNQYTYDRNSPVPVAKSITDTMDNYLYSLFGSIGILSDSITRTKEYNDVIVAKLQETRDNMSAVSLDEEMGDLIKFQHAYAAAAKLITTADEMFMTILETR
jgi:flagellar hook-associated protein 1 FlgK